MKTLIKNATIIDGSGTKGYAGSVLINNDRIEAVGHIENVTADHVIDANKAVVCPGFIDTHDPS